MSAFKKLATNLIIALLLFVVTSVAMAASGQPMLKTSVSSGHEYAERLLSNDGVNGSPQLVAEALHRANRIEGVSVAKAAEYLRQTEVRPCPQGTRTLSAVLNGQLGMVSRPYRANEVCLWDRNTGLVAASAACGNIDLERAGNAVTAPQQEEIFFSPSVQDIQLELTLPSQGGSVIVQDQGMSTGGKATLVGAGLVAGYLVHEALKKPRTVVNNNGVCAGANISVIGNNNATCGSTAPQPVVVCNPPNQLVGGVCVAPVQCTGGQIPAGNTCQCPAGQQLIGNVCQVPVQYCPNGSVRPPNGQCLIVCSGGQIDQGGYCGCPAGTVFINGTCRVPPQQCTGGQILVGDYCQCPLGQQEMGGRCQTILVCTGGQIPFSGVCQCPLGQELFAGVCRVPLPQCPQGQQLVGGICQGPSQQTCPQGEVLFAGVCRIPLPGGG